MNHNKKKSSCHIARRVDYQGARPSVVDQAEVGKRDTGKHPLRNNIQLRNKFKIGTWNVRKMKEYGKLNTVCNEMKRCNIQLLGISETNWNGQGSFRAQGSELVLFSGNEENYSHGVAIILTKEAQNALIGYSPVNDRIIKARLQAKPHNLTIIQCYAPTSLASDEEIDSFYNALQETIDSVPNRDIKIIMGDMNAKVGQQQDRTNPSCGRYGLGERNERGEKFIEFCDSNNLIIANTMFQHHPRHLYTWISPDRKTKNQIDFICFSHKWINCVKDAKTRPSADCNTDHQLLTAEIKFRF